MARNDKKQPISELKGADRLFRTDRDTLIVFSGRGKGEVKPFLRVGAGDSIPDWIAPHIEHVVVPDQDIWNLGQEMQWIGDARQKGLGDAEYVGGRERVQQLTRYVSTGLIDERSKKGNTENKNLLHTRSYDPTKGGARLNDRALITFMNNGSFLVQVDGAKVMDFEKEQRTSLTIDKEYEAVNRSLAKRKLRLESGYGFFYFGDEFETALPIYWGMNGSGLFLNPVQDSHYLFFENRINLERVNMAISGSASSPGFVELFRRKNKTESPLSVFSAEPERVGILKKIYPQVPVSTFDDSRSLTFAKECIFFTSKTRSHGIFSFKLEEKASNMVQILFPLEGVIKNNKSFDFTRGPHDLEIRKVSGKSDLASFEDARLTLFAPEGEEGKLAIQKARISGESYPLVPGNEYGIQYFEDPSEMMNHLLAALIGTGFEEDIRNLVSVVEAENLDLDRFREASIALRGKTLPSDPLILSNIYHSVKFISSLPGFQKKGMQEAHKSYERILARFSLKRIHAAHWLDLREREIGFQILFYRGRQTAFIGLEQEAEEIALHLPPPVEHLAEYQLEYKKYLKQANKVIDKMAQPPQGIRLGLDFCEKLFEFRLRFSEERERLKSILEQLELYRPEEEPTGVMALVSRVAPDLAKKRGFSIPLPSFPEPVHNFFGEVKELVMPFYLRMGKFGKPVSLTILSLLLLAFITLISAGIFSGNGNGGATEAAPVEKQTPEEGQNLEENESIPASESPEESPVEKPVDENTERSTDGKEGAIGSTPIFAVGEGPVPSEFQGARASGVIQKIDPPNPPGVTSSRTGDTPEEKVVSELVPPGDIQRDLLVPGEGEVITRSAEVLQYADELARSNGFTGLKGVKKETNLRDPDLVYPGDTLTLPDGRLVKVEPGETIWTISTIHYKKDMARVRILVRQLNSEVAMNQKKKTGNLNGLS